MEAIAQIARHQNPRRDPLGSVGGELLLRTLPLWFQQMDFRLGVAFPLEGERSPSFYLRLGPSF